MGVDKPWLVASGNNLYACWAKIDNIYKAQNDNATTYRIMFKRILPTAGPELELGSGLSGIDPMTAREVNGCNIAANSNVNGANGVIYVIWTHLLGDPTTANSAAIEMRRSFDNGQSFDTLQTVVTLTRSPTPLGENPVCHADFGCVLGARDPTSQLTSGITTPLFGSISVDNRNNLGVAVQDFSSTTLTDVKFVKITACITSGSNCSFSAVNIVNDGGLFRDQFLPFLVFSSRDSAYHVVALDRRNDQDNFAWQTFDYHCHLESDCAISSNWQVGPLSAGSSTNIENNEPTHFIGDYYAPSSNSQQELLAVFPNNAAGVIRIFSDATLETFLIKAGTFTKSTAGAPVSQSVVGVGFQPKAVILYTTGQTMTTGSSDTYNMAIGFTAGPSNSRTIGVQSDDGSASSNTGRAFGSKLLKILNSGNPIISAEADLVSLDSDGFTIQWTTNDASARIINYIALGGSEITNAAVSSFSASTSAGAQVVSGVGFKPDFVMLMHAGNTLETSMSADAYISYGLASSPTKRAAIAVTSEDGRPKMDTWRYEKSNRVLVALTPSDGTVNAEADLQSLDSDGFTLNWVDPPAAADKVYYLALKGGLYNVGKIDKTIAGAPVTQAITGVGFRPVGGLFASFNNIAATTVQSHNRISIGSTDGFNKEAVFAGDTDNANDAITARSLTPSKTIRMATEQLSGPATIINAEAGMQSFDADGFTLSWSTNDAIAKEIIYVVFGEASTINVVGDSSFESGSLTVNAPEPRGSWGSTGSQFGGQVLVTSEDKHSGVNSLKIITTSNDQIGYVYQYYTLGSTTYSYSFWYKGSAGAGTGEVLRGWGPPSPLVGGPYNPQFGAVMNLGTSSFPLDGQWHRATVINVGTTQAFYRDGIQISCGTGNTNIPDVTIMGDLTASVNSITVYLDEVVVVPTQEYVVSCP
ncbi:MAG TPA: hypothetical protein VGQ13_04025 [Nitrososphaera sp.]|nr:hypothetical protein [Nitrososphaera sp.]